jgi:hypothetical protein
MSDPDVTLPPDTAALVEQQVSAAAIRSAEVALIVKHINHKAEGLEPIVRFEMVMLAADIALGRHRANGARGEVL